MKQVSREHVERERWPIFEPVDGDRINPIALSKAVCVAGDRSHVNLALPSPKVSRVHVLFVTDDHSIYLRDLASLNHVFVNGSPTRESVLANGDSVKIGPYKFRCGSGFPSVEQESEVDPPAAELHIENSDHHVPLTGRTLLIGSRPDCDLRISEALAAPAQAIVFQRHGKHFLRHLRNSHGTFVNDRQVGQVELAVGDLIRIGDISVRYQAATIPALSEDSTFGQNGTPVEEDDELGLLSLADDEGTAPEMESIPDLSEQDFADAIPLQGEDSELPEAALPGLVGAEIHPGQVNRKPEAATRKAQKTNEARVPQRR